MSLMPPRVRAGGLATRPLLALAGALLLAAGTGSITPSTAVAQSQPCAHPYLSVREGVEWRYRAGMPGLPMLATEDVVRITELTPTGFVQTRDVSDAGRLVQRWTCGAQGLSQVSRPNEVVSTTGQGATGSGQFTSPVGITLPPADRWQAGYTWQESYGGSFSMQNVTPGAQPRSEGVVERVHTIVGQEAVTVPAGTFQAWRVETASSSQVTVSLGGPPETLDVTGTRTAWYAERVGLVKAIDTLDGMTIDQMELLSVTP